MDMRDIARVLCRQLEIKMPKIEVGDIPFATETTLAAYIPEEDKIILRSDEETPDSLFALAHEIRHVWQSVWQPDIFAEYKQSADMPVEAYNLQHAEIDANAYAAMVMVTITGLTPLFNGLSERAIEKIWQRAREIDSEL